METITIFYSKNRDHIILGLFIGLLISIISMIPDVINGKYLRLNIHDVMFRLLLTIITCYVCIYMFVGYYGNDKDFCKNGK